MNDAAVDTRVCTCLCGPALSLLLGAKPGVGSLRRLGTPPSPSWGSGGLSPPLSRHDGEALAPCTCLGGGGGGGRREVRCPCGSDLYLTPTRDGECPVCSVASQLV